MTVTARDIIASALERVMVYAPNEPLTDTDAQRGLVVLNDMIDQFAAAYVYTFQITPFVFSVTAAQAVYVGNQPRPYKFIYGPGAGSFLTSGGGTSLVDVVSALEWSQIFNVVPGTGTPSKFYYNATWPNPTYSLSPTPANNGTCTVQQYVILSAFATLDTVYTLSPGGDEMLRSNLCLMLKPYWSNAQIDPLIVAQAGAAKKVYSLQTLNSRAVPGRNRGAPMPPQQGAPQ